MATDNKNTLNPEVKVRFNISYTELFPNGFPKYHLINSEEEEKRYEFQNLYNEIYLSAKRVLGADNSNRLKGDFFDFLIKQKNPIFTEHIQNYLIGLVEAYEHRGGDGKDEIVQYNLRRHSYHDNFIAFIQDVNISNEEKLNIIKNYSILKEKRELQEMCEKELELIAKGEPKQLPEDFYLKQSIERRKFLASLGEINVFMNEEKTDTEEK
jgi:hypothetical protein